MSASRLVKVPEEISFEQAATSMVQGMTAHYLVHTTGRVKPGDKVLIHAISGGTGSLVCQVAKNAGNKSIWFSVWRYPVESFLRDAFRTSVNVTKEGIPPKIAVSHPRTLQDKLSESNLYRNMILN